MFMKQASVHPITHRAHSAPGAYGIAKALETGRISNLRQLYHEWTSRRALQNIRRLDGCHLLDIGLMRSDIETAIASSSASDAMSELRKVRRVNATR